jgi:glucans biosynthesis protein
MNQGRVTTQLANIRAATRCGAKTRTGGACQCPAIRGRNRCRLHGGRSTGAPKGHSNGNFATGEFTAEAIEERHWLRSVVCTYGKLEPS